MDDEGDDLMDFFNLSKEFKKVVLQGSQTGGRVKRTTLDEPPPETNDAHVNNEPLDYYEKYREAERQRMAESATSWYGSTTASVHGAGARSFHAMSGIESDTMAGSIFPSNDMRDDNIDLTKQFDFRKVSSDAHQLPICALKEKILEDVQIYPVVVISGFTGCGKTTQVPQYLLDKHAQDGKRVNIIVTQPRRLAARSVAERVCKERGWELGKLVGYQVGLDKANKTPDTRLLYVTTGVLKRMLIHKKDMNDWTHIILDEVHERDQDMDFVMLLCKQLQNTNSRGVKIVLMSATMNEDKFCEYFPYIFPGCPPQPARAIIVPDKKRVNKVQRYFLENLTIAYPKSQSVPQFEFGDAKLEDYCIEVCRNLIEMLDNLENQQKGKSTKDSKPVETGAVLVFLPGLAEIQTVQGWLREKNLRRLGTKEQPKWWILPLHSSIPIEEHRLVFKRADAGQRKIILSTNIAESSITVPDIVYIIDFCLTKNMRADQETNYPRLIMEWASKQQCDQRMGRAGRVQDGRVYRLVNSNFFAQFNQEHDAELKRAPLSKVVLDTKLLEFGSPKELLALTMDPPDLLKLQKTIVALKEMGAMLTTVNNQLSYDDGDLTVLGEVIAQLPVDVRIGKLIVYGHVFNVLEDAIIIAAGLNGKSVFTAPFEKRIQAYKNKLYWADRSFSDCFAILNAYKTWEQKLVLGEFRMGGNRIDERRREQEFCEKSFLQAKVLQEMKLQVDEIRKNLEMMDIKKLQLQSGGPDRLGEADNQKHIILRLIMFGAFYPNYFQRQDNSDLEVHANRILNNRNPKTCVYLTGFPTDQIKFGPLYENQLKNIFEAAAYQNENTTVIVEGQKVIVEFKKPVASVEEGAMSFTKKDLTTGIIPPVYVATKMRNACRGSMFVKLYTEDEAERRKDDWDRAVNESEERGLNAGHVDQIKPPDMSKSVLEFSVVYVNDPNNFWVHLKEVEGQDELLQSIIGRNIEQLSSPNPAVFKELVRTGGIVLAPFEEVYYRARVNTTVDRNGFATVFFIDYGNMERVKTSELKIINKTFIKQNPDIVRIPGLALECSLSHIQPNQLSSSHGLWSETAINKFKQLIETAEHEKFGKIFSVTKASSGHSNFLVSLESMEVVVEGVKREIKDELLKEKFAEKATESFQSEEDAKERTNYYSLNQAMQEHLNDYKGRYKVEKKSKVRVTEDEDSQSVNCELKGPFSPLEYSVTCAYRQGSNKLAKVEMDSVNSVLLDQNPSDPYEQWMVAAHVGINPSGQNLLLRNTTWLPSIPGLGALATMIFAPQVELRTNANRTKIIGFLAGLGPKVISPQTLLMKKEGKDKMEETHSFFPEHDIEDQFDVEVGNEDINVINKIRYWINQALSKSEEGMSGLIKPQTLHRVQQGIQGHLKTLLEKDRKFTRKEHLTSGKEFRWNLLEKKHRMPSQLGVQDKYFLKMIDGVNLQRHECQDITEKLITQYHQEGTSEQSFHIPLECPVCPIRGNGFKVRMRNAREVFIHNRSEEHAKAEATFKGSF